MLADFNDCDFQIEAKYAYVVANQQNEVDDLRRNEQMVIPVDINYNR